MAGRTPRAAGRRARRSRFIAPSISVAAVAIAPVMTVIGYVADNLAVLAIADARFYLCTLAIGAAFASVHAIAVWEARAWPLRVALGGAAAITLFFAVPDLVGKLSRSAAAKPEITAAVQQSAPIIAENTALTRATYQGSALSGSRLSGTTLREVDFNGADLSESDLRRAVLVNVNMAGVNLCGADLRGADLRGARNLGLVADWRFTLYDDDTTLPDDFELSFLEGPVYDVTGQMLYSCKPNLTRQVLNDGSRK